MLGLLENWIYEDFFDQLRTKQQLGYFVGCRGRCTHGIHGFTFAVESSNYDCCYVETKIFEFLETYINTGFTEEKYSNFLQGLITQKSEPFKDIFDEMRQNMQAFKDYFPTSGQSIQWQRRAAELEFLKTKMTFEMAKETYHRLFLGPERRMAIFRSFSPSNSALAEHVDLEGVVNNTDSSKRVDGVLIKEAHFLMFAPVNV